MPGLDIVPIYLGDRDPMLRRLGDLLEREFRVEARYRSPWFDPEAAFDPSRGQYNSTQILRQLLDDPQTPAERVLGVAGVDLFTPVLTYVFGEAQLRGRAAAVSIHRLRNEMYGLPADDALLFDRLHKEAVHELGHTYGLLHCTSPECVMRASTYAEEIELKSARFCEVCAALVRRAIAVDASGQPTG